MRRTDRSPAAGNAVTRSTQQLDICASCGKKEKKHTWTDGWRGACYQDAHYCPQPMCECCYHQCKQQQGEKVLPWGRKQALPSGRMRETAATKPPPSPLQPAHKQPPVFKCGRNDFKSLSGGRVRGMHCRVEHQLGAQTASEPMQKIQYPVAVMPGGVSKEQLRMLQGVVERQKSSTEIKHPNEPLKSSRRQVIHLWGNSKNTGHDSSGCERCIKHPGMHDAGYKCSLCGATFSSRTKADEHVDGATCSPCDVRPEAASKKGQLGSLPTVGGELNPLPTARAQLVPLVRAVLAATAITQAKLASEAGLSSSGLVSNWLRNKPVSIAINDKMAAWLQRNRKLIPNKQKPQEPASSKSEIDSLNKQLRAALLKLDMNQSQLAIELGVKPVEVSQWLSGKSSQWSSYAKLTKDISTWLVHCDNPEARRACFISRSKPGSECMGEAEDIPYKGSDAEKALRRNIENIDQAHKQLVEAVKQMAAAHQWSQADLAAKAGLGSASVVSNWMNSVRLSQSRLDEIDQKVSATLMASGQDTNNGCVWLPTARAELVPLVGAVIDATAITQANLASEAGLKSAAVVSLWLHRRISTNNTEVDGKMAAWLQRNQDLIPESAISEVQKNRASKGVGRPKSTQAEPMVPSTPAEGQQHSRQPKRPRESQKVSRVASRELGADCLALAVPPRRARRGGGPVASAEAMHGCIGKGDIVELENLLQSG